MSNRNTLYAKALVVALERAKNAKEVAERIARFRRMLKAQRALRRLGGIMQECRRIIGEKEGVYSKIVSAAPLSKAQSSLRPLLEKKGFRVEEEVNKNLIGGVAVLLGRHTLIDASVRGKLQKIRSLLHGHHTSF